MTRRTMLSHCLPPCGAPPPTPEVETGSVSHPKPFWETGARLMSMSQRAVRAQPVHHALLLERAAAEGAQVFAEFPNPQRKGIC